MIALIVVIIAIVIYKACKESKFHNYMPPQGQMVDYNAMHMDRIQNHLTNEQIKQNTVNGKYNRKKNY